MVKKDNRNKSSKKFDVFGIRSTMKTVKDWYTSLTAAIKARINSNADTPIVIEDKAKKDSNSSRSNPGRFLTTALPLLPDIRNAKVEKGKLDWYLKIFGVSRREDSKVTLLKGPNKKANRYLTYHYIRMLKAMYGEITFIRPKLLDSEGYEYRGPSVPYRIDFQKIVKDIDLSKLTRKEKKAHNKKLRTYWGISYQLLRSSTAFQTAILIKVLGKVTRWSHRDFTISDLQKLFKQYKKIVTEFKQDIPVKRSWIPAGEKWRPLGIPPLAWRIYTRGLANLLETFLSPGWPANQHAYTTGRGVGSAWKFILNVIIKAK